MKTVKIGEKWVGDNNPCYVAAEIGGLFKTFEEAKNLIDSAKEIGFDAIKIQTFEANTITTRKNFFNLGVTGHVSQYDFFQKMEVSKELQLEVVKYANDVGLPIYSAPSHIKDLETMKKMNPPAYKIGSDLACHTQLLKEVAKFDKPIILSTGMCTMDEVKRSVKSILNEGNDQIIILHCVSDYPTKIEESNLNAITTMKNEFDFPVGYSDHTIGTLIPLAASIMGANMLEKHFRHPDNSKHADDLHALTPAEFQNLIKSIRDVESAKGSGIKSPSKSEKENLVTNRVSIVSMTEIPKGTLITQDMLDIRRPGFGIEPYYFYDVIGKKARKNISREEPIMWDTIE